MDFNTVMEHTEKALPVVAALVVARYANANSPHWTQWTGHAGRVVGLAVTLLDIFRKPSTVVKNVKKPAKKRGKK